MFEADRGLREVPNGRLECQNWASLIRPRKMERSCYKDVDSRLGSGAEPPNNLSTKLGNYLLALCLSLLFSLFLDRS